ncbi:MAG: GDSL-type esterase/lipase family protein [Clostridiales bacterium]|nr:GDSL-type esterase/lipase family protein [Clostridiales bacterium]
MFIKYDNEAVRLTGRWYKEENAAVTSACGSKIEFSFYGKMAVMHFNMEYNEHPYPHLWIQTDEGVRTEAAVDRYLRIYAEDNGPHNVSVIYKSGMEMQQRWYDPLVGKIAFMGFDAEKPGELKSNNKRYIEFIGDSITEGCQVDFGYNISSDFWPLNAPFQNDVTATYAYITAAALNLEPLIMGYGGVGLTKSGCSSVPRAGLSYEYCCDGHPYELPEPDYIVINHGANDVYSDKTEYLSRYKEFLEQVSKKHPGARIFVLGAFCGWCHEELADLVDEYNMNRDSNVVYINTYGWIPAEPLHPGRDGHKIVAEKLIEILRQY